MEKFIPKGDRILVKPIEPVKKVGGMATPSAQRGKVTRGIVVAVGPLAVKQHMEEILIDRTGEPAYSQLVGIREGVAVGELIEWSEHAGREMKIEGETFRRLRLEEVEGTWEAVDE